MECVEAEVANADHDFGGGLGQFQIGGFSPARALSAENLAASKAVVTAIQDVEGSIALVADGGAFALHSEGLVRWFLNDRIRGCIGGGLHWLRRRMS